MAADGLKEGVVLPVLCRLVNLPPARMCHGQIPHKLTCLACFQELVLSKGLLGMSYSIFCCDSKGIKLNYDTGIKVLYHF